MYHIFFNAVLQSFLCLIALSIFIPVHHYFIHFSPIHHVHHHACGSFYHFCVSSLHQFAIIRFICNDCIIVLSICNLPSFLCIMVLLICNLCIMVLSICNHLQSFLCNHHNFIKSVHRSLQCNHSCASICNHSCV